MTSSYVSYSSAIIFPSLEILLKIFDMSGVRVAGCLQPATHHSNPAAPNLQHTTNREQNDRCGNSTAQSQAPDDGYINARNMLST